MSPHHQVTLALAHVAWLMRHHYMHRAMLELHQILWAMRHGGGA